MLVALLNVLVYSFQRSSSYIHSGKPCLVRSRSAFGSHQASSIPTISTFGSPALRRKYSNVVHCSHADDAFIAMLPKRAPNGRVSCSGSSSRAVHEPTMMESKRLLRITCG